MAVNQPIGDNAPQGAVKKRTQLKNRLGGATAWTKRRKPSGPLRGSGGRGDHHGKRAADKWGRT